MEAEQHPSIEAALAANLDRRAIDSMTERQVRELCASTLGQTRDLTERLRSAYGQVTKLQVELALAKAPPTPREPEPWHLEAARALDHRRLALRSMQRAATGGQ